MNRQINGENNIHSAIQRLETVNDLMQMFYLNE